MDTVTYPTPAAADQLSAFSNCRLDSHAHEDATRRYGVAWTPTLLFLDAEGREAYRFVGFLPPEDFATVLAKARGHLAATAGRWDEAERWFHQVTGRPYGASALYWRGVAQARQGNRDGFMASWKELLEAYPGSPWAKSASFLAGR